MPKTRFLALLRGINVGGNNVIAKEDLQQCFEDLGYEGVRTYIQSGNILFSSGARNIAKLTATIEKGLADRFSYAARAVVLSHKQYIAALDAAPSRWGHVETQKHNALFTLDGITPEEVLAQLPAPKARLERVGTGPRVIFWSASKKELSKTTIMKLSRSPLYLQMTVRNHNTVFRLRDLFLERPASSDR